jgi:hypothetical protein
MFSKCNLLKLTQSHREVWKEVLNHPKLIRVLSPDVDFVQAPVTTEEEIFVPLVTQHLVSVFRAMRKDLTISPEGLRREIWQFFSLPIPQQVWIGIQVMQDDDFVAFVESCRNWK